MGRPLLQRILLKVSVQKTVLKKLSLTNMLYKVLKQLRYLIKPCNSNVVFKTGS